MIEQSFCGYHTPETCQTARLRDLCKKTSLTNPKHNPDDLFTYIDVSSVSNDSYRIVYTRELVSKDAPSRARKLVEKDDVIFATVRPTLKRVAMVPAELDGQICSTGFCVLRADPDKLDPYYLYFYLLTDSVYRRVESLQKGATYPAINDSNLFELVICLPPLPEQRAIASALSAVQAAKSARQREIVLEQERKAALIQHLFTFGTRGEATKRTEIGEIPQSWEIKKLGEACQFLQYGTNQRCDADIEGIPVLRIPNVIGGKIETRDLKFAKLPEKAANSLMLAIGDLLFVRTNGRQEYAGRCAVYNGEFKQAIFASYLIRVRLDPSFLLPEFVQLYNTTPTGKRYLSGKASFAADGKFNINTQTIRSVLTPCPPLLEQKEVIGIGRSLDMKIARMNHESQLLDELFRTMLEELMTGKLSIQPLIGVATT